MRFFGHRGHGARPTEDTQAPSGVGWRFRSGQGFLRFLAIRWGRGFAKRHAGPETKLIGSSFEGFFTTAGRTSEAQQKARNPLGVAGLKIWRSRRESNPKPSDP